jgi:hypothetical protein
MIKNIFFPKSNIGIKNAEFDADFGSGEKFAKNLMQKYYQ